MSIQFLTTLQSDSPSPEELHAALRALALHLDGLSEDRLEVLLSSGQLPQINFFLDLLQKHSAHDSDVNREILDCSTRIVLKLLSNIDYEMINNQFGAVLSLAIEHDDPRIQKLGVGVLFKSCVNESYSSLLANSTLFTSLATFPEPLSLLLSPSESSILSQINDANTTNKLRIYEIFFTLKAQPENQVMADVFRLVHNDLFSSDLLERLNVLELFSGMSVGGSNEIIGEDLGKMLELDVNEGVENRLVVCATLKVLGRWAGQTGVDLVAIDRAWRFIDRVSTLLKFSERDVVEASVVAIGNIGASSEGLKFLHKMVVSSGSKDIHESSELGRIGGMATSVVYTVRETLDSLLVDVFKSATGSLKLECLKALSCCFSSA
ncbi:hypothetical protein HK096_005583, partial [Nowakowskiella sp. JEL0078]